MVDRRRSTVIFVVLGARAVNAERIAVPSSPAPRTRMLAAIVKLRKQYWEEVKSCTVIISQ